MFYRLSSRILLAALIAAALGAFAPTRADDRTSDLELKLKEKEAEYKELQQKVESQQAKQPEEASQTVNPLADSAKRQFDQALKQADRARLQAETARTLFGESPVRVRVQLGTTNAIHTAAAEVRDAKGDDDRKAAQKKLDEALSKYFDEDMVQREKDLKEVEERVTKLRELLERRRASKQEIIDLEAKVALNQANGLGFYDGEATGGPVVHPFFSYGKSTSSSNVAGGFGSQITAPRVKSVPPVPPVKPVPPSEPASADKDKS